MSFSESEREIFSESEKRIIDNIHSGDALRNYTSFLFLQQFKELQPLKESNANGRKKKVADRNIERLNKLLTDITRQGESYQKNYAYGDLYSQFLTALQNSIETTTDKESLANLYPFVDKVYRNKSKALEVSADRVSKATEKLTANEDLFNKTGKVISSFLDRGKKVNKVTPQGAGSLFSRLLSVISSTFKPQLATSPPSVRDYRHKSKVPGPTELRLGTQAEIHNRKARVSPTFKFFLQMEADVARNKREQGEKELSEAEQEDLIKDLINYIYFNSLSLDHSGLEGRREQSMSTVLHEVEHELPNVAVITLPSDQGEMSHDYVHQNAPTVDVKDARRRMLDIALENKNAPKIRDFQISKKVRKLLFGDKQEEKMGELVDKSFEKLGFKNAENISLADQQAVYFHFTKFELTHYIVLKLNPEHINFSCKDGIDRGGVASAYYNLILSIESGHPMNENEFKRALYAAPALVKGRGINSNVERLWNAIDAYIEGQKANPLISIPKWLSDWRDSHAPKNSRLNLISRLDTYINLRTKELYYESGVMHSAYGPKEAKEKSQYNTIFGQYKADDKIKVAEKLRGKLQALKRSESLNPADFTKQELELLNDGRLKVIFQGLKSQGPWSEKRIVTMEKIEQEEDEGEGEGRRAEIKVE